MRKFTTLCIVFACHANAAEIHDATVTQAELNAQPGIVQFTPGQEISVGETTRSPYSFSGQTPNMIVRLGPDDQRAWTIPARAALDEYLENIEHRTDTIGVVTHFDTNETTILDPNVLERIVKSAQENPGAPVFISGYTDNEGGYGQKNWDLSRRRAEAVRLDLMRHGIQQDVITATDRGPTHPIADNHTPNGRASNRRSEVVIDPNKGDAHAAD